MNDSKVVFQRVLGTYARNETIASLEAIQVISTLIKDTAGCIFIDGLGIPASFELTHVGKSKIGFSLTTGAGIVHLDLDSAQVVWTKKYPVLVLKSKAIELSSSPESAFCIISDNEPKTTFYASNFALVLTPIDEEINLKKSKKGLYSFNLHTLFEELKALDFSEAIHLERLKPLFWELLFLDACFHFYSNCQTTIPTLSPKLLLERVATYRDENIQSILIQLSTALEQKLAKEQAQSIRQLISKYAALVKAELTLDAYL